MKSNTLDQHGRRHYHKPFARHHSSTNPCRDDSDSERKIYICNDKPKSKEHIKICSTSFTKKPPSHLIKSVQAALSSIDLITIKRKQSKKETRRIKSHEDIHDRRKDIKYEEILEWLHEIYYVKKVKHWSERLQRIAEKLKKPGGEENLRTKIVKYLKIVPSQFPDFDKDGKEFREQLPDHIIKKLKIYIKKEKLKLRKQDVPKNQKYSKMYIRNGEVEINFKIVIGHWLESIPVKKQDFLDRPNKEEDILNLLVHRLKPFVLHRPYSDHDYKCMLKSYTMEIVSEIPIEIGNDVKRDYVDRITDELVDGLIKIDGKKQDCLKIKHKLSSDSQDSNMEIFEKDTNDEISTIVTHEKTNEKRRKLSNDSDYNSQDSTLKRYVQSAFKNIKDFVTDEITYFFKVTDLGISRKRMGYIEIELSDILIHANKSVQDSNTDKDAQEKIRTVLQDIGSIPEDKAGNFAKILYKHFREIFLKDAFKRPKSISRTFGNAYSENIFVYYNPIHNRSKPKHTYLTKKGIEANLNSYTNKIVNQIDQWLMLLHIETPFAHQPVFREMAIGYLARDIVNRRKYFETNHSNPISDVEELEYLKFQIFKWIGKLVGDQNMEIIEYAPDLMQRIQSVPVPVLNRLQEIKGTRQDIRTPKYIDNEKEEDNLQSYCTENENEEDNLQSYFDLLYGEIFLWLQEIPYNLHYCEDVRTRYQFAENLVDRIGLGIKVKRNIDLVIDTEVDFWIAKALKAKPSQNKISQLKNVIKDVLVESEMCSQEVWSKVEATTSDTENKTDFLTEKVSSDEFEEELELFSTRIAKTIDEWLTNRMPRVQNKSQKNIVIAGLARDLVDRYKAIELNPKIRGTEGDELENFKYYIFKWMKKLAGDDSVVAIEHVPSLIHKIKSISAPKLIEQTHNLNLSTQSSIFPPRSKDDKASDNISNITGFTLTKKYRLEPQSRPDQVTKPNYILSVNNDNSNTMFGLKHEETQVGQSCIEIEEASLDDRNNISVIPKETTQLSPNRQNSNDPNHQQMVNFDPDKISVKSNFRLREKSPVYIKSFSDESGRNITLNRGKIFGRMHAEKTERPEDEGNTKFNSLSYTVNSLAPNRTEVYSFGSRKNTIKEDGSLPSSEPSQSLSIQENILNIPQGLTVNETYLYFDKIFKEKILELPIPVTTEEQKSLAEVTRTVIYNGIWKTYFKLKSDPNIENDYGLFESSFEDELDTLLDCLPQTPEIEAIRHVWKLKVIQDNLDMLKCIHSITDAPSFRQHLTKKFNRKFLKNRLVKYSDQLQYAFISDAADAFILYTKFKNDDPLKANVYRQRLMKKLQELADHVKKTNNVEFRFVNQNQLCQEAFKILGSVPIPNNETLNSEAEEILLGDEIERWYKELPVKPNESVFDDLMRNKMKELLTKKLHEIEKRKNPEDPEAEKEMKHEISKFLAENVGLEQDASLNINYMVDALTNRLRNRRLDALGFNTFEQERPVSSTFAHPEPAILVPLVNNQVTRSTIGRPLTLKPDIAKREYAQIIDAPLFNTGVKGSSRIAGPSTAGYAQEITRPGLLKPHTTQRFTANPTISTGILGDSHEAGPNAVFTGYGILRNQTNSPAFGNFLGSNQVPEPITNVATDFPNPTPVAGFQVNQSYNMPLGLIQNYAGAPFDQRPPGSIERPVIQHPALESDGLLPIDEELDDAQDEIVSCRCMKRVCRSQRKKFYCLEDDLERYPCLYDMVYPYRYRMY